jgi:hypothetical protein
MIWYLAIPYQHGIGIARNAGDGTIGISMTKSCSFGTTGSCECGGSCWRNDAADEVRCMHYA